ncbi:hypothetical protein [Fortiea contorta]|uniref:hypothetical protein n=1 Tax=Fortiea contorta TaxID=1892405 RepID=UPI0003456ECC|nr:hypothetical protein [Fortiea contorta]
MYRITQIIQNAYIRIEALFSVVFGGLFSLLKSFFGLFAKIFGFNSSSYFVESEAQGSEVKQSTAPEPKQLTENKTPVVESSPQKTKKVENYYLNMARDVKKN